MVRRSAISRKIPVGSANHSGPMRKMTADCLPGAGRFFYSAKCSVHSRRYSAGVWRSSKRMAAAEYTGQFRQ